MIKAGCRLSIGVVVLALAGCGGGSDRAGGDPGAQLVDDGGCLACHRLGGDGNDTAAALDGVGSRHDRAAIERILTDPPTGMPSYQSRFSAEERRTLVEYLLRQR